MVGIHRMCLWLQEMPNENEDMLLSIQSLMNTKYPLFDDYQDDDIDDAPTFDVYHSDVVFNVYLIAMSYHIDLERNTEGIVECFDLPCNKDGHQDPFDEVHSCRSHVTFIHDLIMYHWIDTLD